MVLVINTGSSSIKMALIAMDTEQLIAEGMADRLGESGAALRWSIGGYQSDSRPTDPDHAGAMQQMLETLFSHIDKHAINAVGHRVVHGGERFEEPALLDDESIQAIEDISHLAPLHNPANLIGIRAALLHLPSIPHIAVFDTAFHHAMPQRASQYAVPHAWYSDYGVRRYGFHGTSHHYVGLEAAKRLQREFTDCRMITAHLGNGCSAAAIADGASVDTTMGMTPLEGLVMGTRSGNVDPGLHDFIARQSGLSLAQITDVLNRQSGLLGLSGQSNDMRTLLEAVEQGDERAALAVDVFCYRLAKSLAALAVPLGHVDALIFTGGIGEHAAAVRARTVELLGVLGASLDVSLNEMHGADSNGLISREESLPVFVIATNEEAMIARYVRDAMLKNDRKTDAEKESQS